MVWGVSESTRHTVRALLRARGGWAFTRDPRHEGVALQWASPPDIFWDSVLSGRSVANHAPARSGLVRKAELARNLQRTGGDASFSGGGGNGSNGGGSFPSPLPLTYTSFEILKDVPVDDAPAQLQRACDFIARLLQVSGGAWVLKASESSNGAAVLPFDSSSNGVAMGALRELVQKARPWLLQRYVERPLLAKEGRKTHCRGYVLVLGPPSVTGGRSNGPDQAIISTPCSVFLHKDLVPVFLSAEPFSTDDISTNKFAHLTNRSVQQDHPDYNQDTQAMSLDQLAEELAVTPGTNHTGRKPQDLREELFGRMAGVAYATFANLEGRPKEYFGTPQCFELFGMDVMFDENLRCWLLEFNALPGLDTLDDDQREVLLDDVISLAVDPLQPPANPPPAHASSGTSEGSEAFENGFIGVSEASVGWRPALSPDRPALLPAGSGATDLDPLHRPLELEESSSGDDSFNSVEEEEAASDVIMLDENGERDRAEDLQVAALSALEKRQAGLVWAGEPPDGWVS